jgi:hypothetical protein
MANGNYVMRTAGGHAYGLDNAGRIRVYSQGNRTASFDQTGRLQVIRTPNMVLVRRPGRERLVESVDPNGTRIVSSGRQTGYIERPISVGSTTLMQRTTLYGNTVSVTYYRSVGYGNMTLEAFVPATIYAAGFYLWLQSPWSTPVGYQQINQGPALTASATGDYFQPEAAYSSPAMLMTDQVIAAQLGPVEDRLMQADASSDPSLSAYPDLPRIAAPETTPISQPLKVAVSQQLGEVLTRDSQAVQGQAQLVPAMLDPSIRYYFVDDALDVLTIRGDSHCTLSKGDALYMSTPAPPNSAQAELLVSSSLKGDCPSGSHVAVNVADLQAMNNHCHESLSAAADRLASQGGQNGIPAPPPAGAHPALPGLQIAAVENPSNTAALIAAQQAQATSLEADTEAAAQSGLH